MSTSTQTQMDSETSPRASHVIRVIERIARLTFKNSVAPGLPPLVVVLSNRGRGRGSNDVTVIHGRGSNGDTGDRGDTGDTGDTRRIRTLMFHDAQCDALRAVPFELIKSYSFAPNCMWEVVNMINAKDGSRATQLDSSTPVHVFRSIEEAGESVLVIVDPNVPNRPFIVTPEGFCFVPSAAPDAAACHACACA